VLSTGQGSLTIACYNLGGPSITKERFGHTIGAICAMFPILPKLISLGEFKPTGADLFEYEWMVTVMSRGQYHLLASVDPQGKNGIALLVHQDMTPRGPPTFQVLLHARVITFQCKIHADPAIPAVTFAAVYGSCLRPDRIQLKDALSPLLRSPTVIFGDLNAIMREDDVTNITLSHAHSLLWPWLRDQEKSGVVMDLMRAAYQDPPPKTRYRGHPGCSRLDHVLVTKSLLPLITPANPITAPLTHAGRPLSDHDLVSIEITPWAESPPPPLRCQGWGRKHITRFQKLCSEFPQEDFDSLPSLEQVQTMVRLQEHMLHCLEEVNQAHPRVHAQSIPEWAAHVKSLLRLSRRNPKLFFRRVRSNGLAPMCNPRPPMDPAFLTSLVQETMAFDPSVVETIPCPQGQMPEIPPPSDEVLFQHSRVPRAKSPGPDGVPPYLFYILPRHLFHLFANCIRLSLSLTCPLPHFFDATLIGLYKPKKDWWTPGAWRPIAMSTAGYRIGMRFIKGHISQWTYSFLSPTQFGGRPGRSTASATHCLMEDLMAQQHQTHPPQAVFLDVRNAFSSVPFSAMLSLLHHLNFSPDFLRLFSHILHQGRFHIPSTCTSFHASSGIRQGCPLSAMMFVLYYEIALRLLERWHPVAFVDDVAVVTGTTQETVIFVREAQEALQRMGLDLNVPKSEVLLVHSTTASPISIPPFHSHTGHSWMHQPKPIGQHPPPPIQPCPQPLPIPPSDLPTSLHVTHLGHPLTADLNPESMSAKVMDSVQETFSQFHGRPLPLYARLKVLNHLIVPQTLYRMECIPPVQKHLDHLSLLTRRFLLALTDAPSFLANKTLFSHRKAGLGAFHLPTLVPQRVLDVVHRVRMLSITEGSALPTQGWLSRCLTGACATLGVPQPPVCRASPPESTTPTAHRSTPLDLPFYEVTHPLSLPPNTAYADGSFFPSVSQCASSVILPNHRACVLRPRGRASCYRAEVFALALAVEVVDPGSTIYTDSAAALAAVKGSSPRVTLAHPIHYIRQQVAEKHLVLQHVRGHQGIVGNETADKVAKEACRTLPQPPPQIRQSPWDICVHGELQTAPHKTWVRQLTPQHAHQDIHSWSWRPIGRPGWLRWLFGCKSVKGFAHPTTYWNNHSSATPCSFCHMLHNQSVHGVIGQCEAAQGNPLVHAWLQSWGPHMHSVAGWRMQASRRDRFLLGKLVLPNSLVAFLKDNLGNRGAAAAARKFQATILPSLQNVLPQWCAEERSAFKRKLNPYEASGWNTGPAPLPASTPRRVPRPTSARLPRQKRPRNQPTLTAFLHPPPHEHPPHPTNSAP
jgi:ribonuclease HI